MLGDLRAAVSHEPSLPSLDGQIAHLTCLGFAEAGVLAYRSPLDGRRATEFNRYRPLLGMIADRAAAEVRRIGR